MLTEWLQEQVTASESANRMTVISTQGNTAQGTAVSRAFGNYRQFKVSNMGHKTSTHSNYLHGQIKTSNYCKERTKNLDLPSTNGCILPRRHGGGGKKEFTHARFRIR